MEIKELCDVFSYEKIAEYENIYGLCEAIDLFYKNTGNQINWENVLEGLKRYSSVIGEFNIFPDSLTDYDSFLKLKYDIGDALAGTKPLIRRRCMECQKLFYIFKSEKDFMITQGLMLPKRCKDCRKKRKLERLKGIN